MNVIFESLARRIGLPLVASLGICSLGLMAPSTAKAIPIIVNGSFESPNLGALPDGYYSVVPTGWTASSGGIVRGVATGLFPYTAPLAEDGSQYSLNGTGGNWIQQTFTIGIGGNYQLTWFDNTLLPGTATPGPTAYDVFVYNSSLTAVASASLGPFSGSSTWNARSLAMALGPGSYTLRFQNYPNANGFYYALDNVSLDGVPSTGVADSGSTLGLLSLALGGLAFISRKRPALT